MDKYEELNNRIMKLEKWMAQKTAQQIDFPLDIKSQKNLAYYFMSISSIVKTIAGAAGHEFEYYIGKQNDKEFQVDKNTFIPYTVNPSTDYLTVQKITFQNDDQIYVSTSDTAPSPLVAGNPYFVVSSNGLSFKLSLTLGGAAINITDAGVGSQYIYFY